MSGVSRRVLRRVSRPVVRCVVVVTSVVVLGGCGSGSGGGAAAPSTNPVATQLQDQLDVLPQIDGAQRTAQDLAAGTLTESFTVPAGSPACLQVLARLDAGGYDVVAGTDQAAVDPTTCRTAAGDPGVDTAAGTATILARGGSEVALMWTLTGYTISVSAN